MNAADNPLRDRLVAMTRDLILIPGTEERPEDLRRSLDWVRNHLEGIEGLEITLHDCHGTVSLVALPQGCMKPDALLCGHVDVVHHSDPKSYKSDISSGRIIGPGSGDMKGNVAILIDLMRSFHGERSGVSLGLAITTDEERGGEHGTRALFEDSGLDCGIAIVPDGGGIDEIVIEEKGILHLELHATGVSCHAARPWLGDNALDRLTQAIASVGAEFPAPESTDHWHATATVTRLSTPNRSFNRVPSHATATLDVRFPAPSALEDVIHRVRSCLGEGVTAEVIIGAEPGILAPDPAYLAACESVLGYPPRTLREHGGSDARFIAARGIPVIMSRPLCGNLHSREEWIDIGSMLTFHQILRHYLERRLLK